MISFTQKDLDGADLTWRSTRRGRARHAVRNGLSVCGAVVKGRPDWPWDPSDSEACKVCLRQLRKPRIKTEETNLLAIVKMTWDDLDDTEKGILHLAATVGGGQIEGRLGFEKTAVLAGPNGLLPRSVGEAIERLAARWHSERAGSGTA